MSARLSARRAIITGGAKGVGAAAARLFTNEGAHVAIFDVDKVAGELLVEELREQGAAAHFYAVDVSDAVGVETAVASAIAALGGVDILFNHAGTFIVRRLIDMSEEEWDRLMSINVKSMFLMSRYVLPTMIDQRSGVILNTSSISGFTASPLESAYCATKGAILQLTKAIALEYREYGIRCNAICPGFIHTDHGDRERIELSHYGQDLSDEAIAAQQGRISEPEDIAAAALSLVSDDSGFVNGTFLVVDNGLTAMT